MCTILSTLSSIGSSVGLVLAALRGLGADLSALRARARAAPGLPADSPSRPFWLTDPPFPALTTARSDELPDEADVVVIGSGITAAAAAWGMLGGASSGGGDEEGSAGERRTRRLPRVVVLEARELGSGATARNGGLMKPEPEESFTRIRELLGGSSERAAAVTRFQLRNIACLVDLCRREGWDAAECREGPTVDLFLDRDRFIEAKAAVAEVQLHVPEFAVEVIDDPAQARRRFNASSYVVGALMYSAGALWPYRLVASAWDGLLAAHPSRLSIETGTPATDITVSAAAAAAYPYAVATPRGVVRARHVLHATNGWAGQLVPGLRGVLSGIRCHAMARLVAASGDDDGGGPIGYVGAETVGERTFSVFYTGGFEYASQRPAAGGSGGGELIIGGGFFRSPGAGRDMVGSWNDGAAVLDPLTLSHLHGILPTIFPAGSAWARTTASREWSGIVAVTGDLLPLVGRLEGALTGRRRPRHATRGRGRGAAPEDGGEDAVAPGEWIAAGYNGNGMVMAWLCGVAVGAMITGEAGSDLAGFPGRPAGPVDKWLPGDLIVSVERARGRARLEKLAQMFM